MSLSVSYKTAVNFYKNVYENSSYREFLEKFPPGFAWNKHKNDFQRDYIEPYINKELSKSKTEQLVKDLIEPASYNSSYLYPEEAKKWHLNRLKNKGIEIRNYYKKYQESVFIRKSLKTKIDDSRYFSIDSFRYLAYLDLIQEKLIDIKKISSYLELGSGNGGLARTICTLSTSAKRLFLSDLPEGLFLAYIFLKSSKIDCDLYLCTTPDDVKKGIKNSLKKKTIILLTPNNLNTLIESNVEIDLFANTRSAGEIKENVLNHYASLLNKIKINNIFLENRFLNRTQHPYYKLKGFRKNENRGSTWMNDMWDLICFNLEPDWSMSPYETDHTRVLALCMKGNKRKSNFLYQNINAKETIKYISEQNWNKHFNRYSRQSMDRFTISFHEETLAYLFDINRKCPTEESLKLMLRYLNILSRGRETEDFYFYKKKYFKLTNKNFTERIIFEFEYPLIRFWDRYILRRKRYPHF